MKELSGLRGHADEASSPAIGDPISAMVFGCVFAGTLFADVIGAFPAPPRILGEQQAGRALSGMEHAWDISYAFAMVGWFLSIGGLHGARLIGKGTVLAMLLLGCAQFLFVNMAATGGSFGCLVLDSFACLGIAAVSCEALGWRMGTTVSVLAYGCALLLGVWQGGIGDGTGLDALLLTGGESGQVITVYPLIPWVLVYVAGYGAHVSGGGKKSILLGVALLVAHLMYLLLAAGGTYRDMVATPPDFLCLTGAGSLYFFLGVLSSLAPPCQLRRTRRSIGLGLISVAALLFWIGVFVVRWRIGSHL